MKLVDFAKKHNISMPTAYRWFHSGELEKHPSVSSVHQTASGTIMVQEKQEQFHNDPEAIADFLRKVYQLQNSEITGEDFSGYILSNYHLVKAK
jgi:hypothetical protein